MKKVFSIYFETQLLKWKHFSIKVAELAILYNICMDIIFLMPTVFAVQQKNLCIYTFLSQIENNGGNLKISKSPPKFKMALYFD